jgi:hypothetical protein
MPAKPAAAVVEPEISPAVMSPPVRPSASIPQLLSQRAEAVRTPHQAVKVLFAAIVMLALIAAGFVAYRMESKR